MRIRCVLGLSLASCLAASGLGAQQSQSDTEAKRGDTVVAIVLFTGCARNRRGKCKVQVEYRVLEPSDGWLPVRSRPERAARRVTIEWIATATPDNRRVP